MGRFFYTIERFFLLENPPLSLGGYGFSVSLDGEFARKAIQTPLPEGAYEELTSSAEEIIKRVGLIQFVEKLYHFVQNKKGNSTCLLHFCQVPGEGCDLALELDRARRLKEEKGSFVIKYTPHNVDFCNQAYALLSIWLEWADMMHAFLKF